MMKCESCKYEYGTADAGTCMDCYEEAGEIEEELKGKVNFLRFEATPCFTDVVLVVAFDKDSGKPVSNSVPVPANKAVLASRSQDYCEKFLVSKLNWESSLISYSFAHQHNAKNLLDASLSLISDNIEKLSKREEYMELVQKEPRLLVEIYEAYHQSKQVDTTTAEPTQ